MKGKWMKAFTWLMERKRVQVGRSGLEKGMCPVCGHAVPVNGDGQWSWLAGMNGILPVEWICDESGSAENFCGCDDPSHLRHG
jgi:hypothetical protein